MYSKKPQVTQPKGRPPVIKAVEKATWNGLKALKQADARISKKVPKFVAKKNKAKTNRTLPSGYKL